MRFKNLWVLICTLTIIAACTNRNEHSIDEEFYQKIDLSQFKKGDINFRLTERESKEILQSEEAKKMIEQMNSFLEKIREAQERGVDIQYLKKAAKKGVYKNDDAEFLTLIFGTPQAGRKFINEMVQTRSLFFEKNKILQENTNAFGCLECEVSEEVDVDDFFSKFDGYYERSSLWSTPSHKKLDRSSYKVDPIDYGDPVCGSYWQQVKLLGCMALCSGATAGLGTALCGWSCWCMLCPDNSELANAIC